MILVNFCHDNLFRSFVEDLLKVEKAAKTIKSISHPDSCGFIDETLTTATNKDVDIELLKRLAEAVPIVLEKLSKQKHCPTEWKIEEKKIKSRCVIHVGCVFVLFMTCKFDNKQVQSNSCVVCRMLYVLCSV